MRSLIILEVEHGETTDDLSDIPSMVNLELAARALRENRASSRSRVINYTVRIDVPECFRLEK